MAMITVNKAIVQAAIARYQAAVLEQRSERLKCRLAQLMKPYRPFPWLKLKQRSEAEAMFIVHSVAEEGFDAMQSSASLKQSSVLMGMCNACNREDITLTEDEDWLLPYLSLRDRT